MLSAMNVRIDPTWKAELQDVFDSEQFRRTAEFVRSQYAATTVNPGVRFPPSLMNIFKEVHDDTGAPIPADGDLSRWATQGVLMLNATLTVEADRAGSHQNQGWEEFTDEVIRRLSRDREHLVFILWGSYAIRKSALIDSSRHLVLISPHPSPLSAHRGFFGNHHFSRANAYLAANGLTPVQW